MVNQGAKRRKDIALFLREVELNNGHFPRTRRLSGQLVVLPVPRSLRAPAGLGQVEEAE